MTDPKHTSIHSQLLNLLMGESSSEERMKVLSGKVSKETLSMNDRYFFKLLDRMTNDVKKQPESDKKQELVDRLERIRKEASNALFV